MQKISLSVDLVNSVLQYMAGRPFQEVFQLIDSIQKEAQAAQGAPQEVPPGTVVESD
jgi:hypothetical protein